MKDFFRYFFSVSVLGAGVVALLVGLRGTAFASRQAQLPDVDVLQPYLDTLSGDIEGIKDPLLIHDPALYFWIAAIIVVVLLCAGGLVFFLTRKKKVGVILSPAERAEKDIAQAKFQYQQNDEITHIIFSQHVVEIFRQYLLERFGIHAPSLTTNELFNMFEQEGFSALLIKRIRERLNHCLHLVDMMKFGGFSLEEESVIELEKAVSGVITLLETEEFGEER